MKKYENNPKEFINSLTDEEFRMLLEDAGFEVEDGEGKIIFTERFDLNEKSTQPVKYSLNQNNSFIIKSEKTKIDFAFAA